MEEVQYLTEKKEMKYFEVKKSCLNHDNNTRESVWFG